MPLVFYLIKESNANRRYRVHIENGIPEEMKADRIETKAVFLFPGEDRIWGGNLLYIDLIPATSWFTNVRSALSSREWNSLAGRIRERSNFKCEICSRVTKRAPDVHERWKYDIADGCYTQRLMRLIALCTSCHGATHMGFAETIGRGDQMMRHMMRINRWSSIEFLEHRTKAFDVWHVRSQVKWDLDLSMLQSCGYNLSRE